MVKFLLLLSTICCLFLSTANASPAHTMDLTFIGSHLGKSFYAGKNQTNYQGAETECRSANMTLAALENSGEFDLVRALVGEGVVFHVWLGGRSIQTKEMYQWSDSKQPLGEYVAFYNYIEEGFMGLTMNRAVGSSLHGVFSEKVGPVALCQKLE